MTELLQSTHLGLQPLNVIFACVYLWTLYGHPFSIIKLHSFHDTKVTRAQKLGALTTGYKLPQAALELLKARAAPVSA